MLHTLVLLSMIEGASPASLTTPEIVERMIEADKDRLAVLAGYTCMRRYHFENARVNKKADMTVRMTCNEAGVKRFDVVSENGSGIIRNRVLRKMIEAEEDASQTAEREQTRIIPANYEFSLIGTEKSDGRDSYVLEIKPRTMNKFLIVGRIWVDAEDYAITRVEGRPAKNPSFWIRSVQVVQKYGRNGPFWLPMLNESDAQARIFGATKVSIVYFNYVPIVRDAQSRNGKAGEAMR